MLDIFNSEKNSKIFLEFNKVADIPIKGFNNIENEKVEFRNAMITIKRNTNLVSDVLYFERKNLHNPPRNPNQLFSFLVSYTQKY